MAQAYNSGGAAGVASATAATAGLIKIDNPASGDLSAAIIREFSIGPDSNSEDSTYAVQLKRQTTAGTWTSTTPNAVDARNTVASIATAGRASTAAGSASSVIAGPFGFHHNGGIRVVPVPGFEWTLNPTASNGIILEYLTIQGTAVNVAAFMFTE
jgi:hypothetical protein